MKDGGDGGSFGMYIEFALLFVLVGVPLSFVVRVSVSVILSSYSDQFSFPLRLLLQAVGGLGFEFCVFVVVGLLEACFSE